MWIGSDFGGVMGLANILLESGNYGGLSGDRLGKIKPLSTDIEVTVDKPDVTKKLSTELSTYQDGV